jgi:eukaryotic-like serine/threonine-protein kinase
MTAETDKLRELFLAALKIPADERDAHLGAACAEDGDLRERARRLLQAHEELGTIASSPQSPSSPTVHEPPAAEQPGAVIGPYKLLERIGEGGMGRVWMAQQTEPVKRLVAVKLIKAGMDSKGVIARFEAERQALALMDHPNIAKVLDAGTIGSEHAAQASAEPDHLLALRAYTAGRPYFVMDLVKGVPITKYCDENRLTPRQRLELFIPVCQAVQHAHQKGIIHRDLKPSNVLVALYDDKPVPKVIDFGVAKATGTSLTDETLHTGFGAVVGTVEYMSPEQASFNQLDIDTRSDVYSLGVLLYELLAGSPPFSKKELAQAGMLETLRKIREEEPTKPSAKLSTAEGLATLAANRGTEPAKLTKLVRGELDWIVMKALEKDRNRRYETANAFAADVQRYLHDEPVQACPPSIWYRFRKFARRNKRPVLAAAVVVLALVGGIIGTTWGMLRATDALGREKQAKDDLIQRLYYQWIAAAAHDRAKNRHVRAEELLEQCPPHLRGWEWHYVKRLPFAEVLKLPHGDVVHRVAWSPDGRLLASGSLKGWVKVWDARTGDLLFHREAHKGFVMGVAFSPKGYLATGGEDDRVKLWDLSRPDRPVREFPTSAGTTVHALEFSPDGRYLAAAEQTRKVRLWELTSGGEVLSPWDDRLAAGGLAFTPDSHYLLTVSTEGVVKTLELPGGRVVATFRADTRGAVGYRVAFNRDRGLLALGCEDGTVKIIRTEPLKEVRTLEAHAGEVCGLAFGPSDERLVSAGEDFTLKIWDLRTGQEAFVLEIIARRANGLEFSPDGNRLAVGSGDGIVRILDGKPLEGPGDAGQLLTLEGHEHAVVGLAYSPDGGRIASASRDETARVWNAQTGRVVVTFRGHRAALTGVAWAPDGGHVASASWDGTARVWDPATGAEVLPALDAAAGPVYGLAFNRDGGALATAHHDRSVRVWDTATGQLKVCIPEAHTQPVLGVAFSPCGKDLVSAGGKDNKIKIWDWRADPKKPLRTLTAAGILRNPAFSPDGRRLLAVAATPAQVWWWDLTTITNGEEKEPLRPNAWKVSQAIFRPGGRLAVVSSDRVQFLEADGAEGPAPLIGRHTGEIGCAAFSPDGRRLATGAGYKGRGEIRIWDASQWEKKP